MLEVALKFGGMLLGLLWRLFCNYVLENLYKHFLGGEWACLNLTYIHIEHVVLNVPGRSTWDVLK